MRSLGSSFSFLSLALSLVSVWALACAHAPPESAPTAAGLSASDIDRGLATAILEQGADDLDVGVRVRALRYLILSSPEPAGGAWGARGVWDPSPWVERAAIRALAQREDGPASRDLLAVVVRREGLDPYVRGAAAVRLAQVQDRTTLPELQLALSGSLAPWQVAPLALAAAMMGDETALPPLVAALREGELPLDRPFFSDLGRSGLAGLEDALVQTLSVVEAPARGPVAAALLGLGSAKGARALESLLGAADAARGDGVDVVDLLVMMDGAGVVDVLHKAARGPAGVARTYARLALLLHDEGDLRILEDSCAAADPQVRAVAVRVAGLMATRAAAEHRAERAVKRCLGAALADDSDLVRLEAVTALASAQRRSEARALPSLFDSELPELRVEAAGVALLLSQP